MFNQVTDDANATSGSLKRAFQRANNAKLKVDREYFQLFEDLTSMGMSQREIMTVLKKNNIGGYKNIIRGEFQPFQLTKKNVQEMRDAGIFDRYPRDEIRQIQEEMRGTSLKPDDELFIDTAPQTNPDFKDLVPSVPVAPEVNFDDLIPQRQGSLPQPTFPVTTARAPGPVNPALLGGTPAERAANAFLSDRS
jgi:hypothetical protein